MGRTGVLQEVRKMRFNDAFSRWSQGRLSCEAAADLLGVSVGNFFSLAGRIRGKGEAMWATVHDLVLPEIESHRQ